MMVGLLLFSLAAAVIGSAVTWLLAGFWWAMAAYVGIGAGTVLLIGLIRAVDPPAQSKPSGHRLGHPETAG